MAGAGMGVAGQAPLYERLRAAILDGDFKAGEPLVETALAGAYGVSRTPVREALRRLEQDGIVQRAGRQLVVRMTTPAEVLEIYDCRTVLEGMAAAWAARQRTDYDLAMLERALKAMADLRPGTPSEMSTVNHVFHDQLWQASHNATLCDLLRRLEVHIRRYPEPTVSQPGRWQAAVDEHAAILTAVREQDTATAERLGREHMMAARDIRLRMIQHAD